MTNDEKELMRDLINQASNKVELLQKTVIEKDVEIGELKAKIKQAQIDVLNKLKERAIGYTFLGEKLATEADIDKLIKEIEEK